jgi:hypothetical protein
MSISVGCGNRYEAGIVVSTLYMKQNISKYMYFIFGIHINTNSNDGDVSGLLKILLL